jgi:hypothetical protein
MPKSRPVQERFWEKVEEDPETGCWLWTASLANYGYGQFGITPRKIVKAHRFAYQTMVGEIPDGLELDHLCRTPRCVNPDHLDPVPHAVNVRRGDAGWATGRTYRAMAECKKGHTKTAENAIISADGIRRCKDCSRLSSARYRARKKAA